MHDLSPRTRTQPQTADRATPRPKPKTSGREIVATLAPLIGLAVLVAAFLITGTVSGTNMAYSLQNLINQSVIIVIIATGAIFIFAMGSFDISLGASTLVAAMTGALAYNATESIWIMLGVCIVTAVATSVVSATLAAVFDLPVFVTTVAMLSVLGAIAVALVQTTGGAQIRVDSGFARAHDTLGMKIAVAAVFLVLCVVLFSFTRLGRVEKLIGGNPVNAKLTGISMKRTAIIAFAIAGLGVGLGAFLTVLRTPTLTTTTAGDIGMNVLVAMVFGGMPITGGPRTRIYAALIGGLSMAVLNQTLTILLASSSAGNGIAQVVRAVFFLAVVWIASHSVRTRTLPR